MFLGFKMTKVMYKGYPVETCYRGIGASSILIVTSSGLLDGKLGTVLDDVTTRILQASVTRSQVQTRKPFYITLSMNGTL